MSRCLICYADDLAEGQLYHLSCSKKFFGSQGAPVFNYELSDITELAKRMVQSQGIVVGVQPKVSLGLERNRNQRARLTPIMGEYILKPPNPDYPEMPEVEDLTMHLAEVFKIKTVPHALMPLKSGELAYITRRIDRLGSSKLHMEDFCQLSELLTEDKYKSSMERVGKLVTRYSQYAGLDLVNLFELTIFYFLTGNNDMHLKNFSLIKAQQGWHMSPAYDLLNVNLVNPVDKEESALTINGKKRRLSLQDFHSLAASYGLNDAQVRHALAKFQDTGQVERWIEQSFLSSDFKTGYLAIFKERLSRLS